MERRSELRAEANEPVVIVELGSQSPDPMGGMIQDISGSGMRIKLPRAVACSRLLRVEASNMLLLAEVVRCEPDGEGFRVALNIRHSLQDLQDLENLQRALTDTERVEEKVHPAAHIANPIMRE